MTTLEELRNRWVFPAWALLPMHSLRRLIELESRQALAMAADVGLPK